MILGFYIRVYSFEGLRSGLGLSGFRFYMALNGLQETLGFGLTQKFPHSSVVPTYKVSVQDECGPLVLERGRGRVRETERRVSLLMHGHV